MEPTIRTYSKCICLLLACALLAQSAAFAAPRPLTPEAARARIVKRGIGNWAGVQVRSGAAFAGIIVSIDDYSFGMQLHNDPAITPVLYSDVVYLQTGLTNGQQAWFIAAPIAFAGVSLGIVFAMRKSPPELPTRPTQPVFP